MAGINKVILVGNLGADPEVRTLENGTKVAQFNMATTESYKDKDGNWQDQTEWHRIVLWRQLAERAGGSLHKGSKIYLEGKLRTRSWVNKDNQTNYTTEIIGDKMLLLDKREGGGSFNSAPITEEDYSTRPASASSQVAPPMPDFSSTQNADDLPF